MPAQDSRTARRASDFAFALEPGAHAPAGARRELQARLPGGLPPSLVDDMLLLTTELVTNSVRHSPAAGGSVDVAVLLAPDRIRVEVSDPGTGFAHVPQHPGTLSEGGRGLFLIDVIAERWGMGEGGRTTVWYELSVERDDAPARAGAGTGAAVGASAELDQVPAGSGASERQLSTDAGELAEELRALGAATESLEDRARDIEADLARVSKSLKAGAEALRTREKVIEPEAPRENAETS